MFGQSATIPDADIAKVMYYLDCVCTVIDYNDNDIRRYRNYSNWMNMSDEEDRLIFILALALSPDEFDDRVFFNNVRLCQGSGNQFYEIGQVKNQLLVVQSILIGGRSRQVKKIMAYTSGWMQRNYYQPMQALAYRFSPQGQREEAVRRAVISQSCTIS
ncbi:unnamed protein product [Adineta steineri]|uniref:Uncharacterized protein n=1 Tax=Adineta steineri TaxID=433720 RepID=A0A814RGY7_9BILA|nr:unnamed protein product [Adineta steineri]CAF3907564.1 unnamed protein product [Adineta steineri]